MSAELLGNWTSLVVALTTLMTAIGALLKAIERYFKDSESRWKLPLGIAILSFLAAAQLFVWLKVGVETDKVAQPDGDSKLGLPSRMHLLTDYVDAYEQTSERLQQLALLPVFQSDFSLRIDFRRDQKTAAGHFTMITDEEAARIIDEVETHLREQNMTDAVFLILGYADKQSATPAYNRKVSLLRALQVRALLMNRLKIDASAFLVVPLGDSISEQTTDPWEWRKAELRILSRTQLAGSSPSPIPAQADSPATAEPIESQDVAFLRLLIKTSYQRRAGTKANVMLSIGDRSLELTGDFEKGSKVFEELPLDPPIALRDIQTSRIALSHDDSGRSPNWDVEFVRIEISTDGEQFSLLRDNQDIGWLEAPDTLSRVLQEPQHDEQASGP